MPYSADSMKTTRRSHFAALGSCLAAFFGMRWKPASAGSARCASAAPGFSPRAGRGPEIVTSPDGRTRTYLDAQGKILRTDRFDERGRLVESVATDGRTRQFCATYRYGRR